MKNIFSIIVILISLASFVFVVKPQYEQIKELEKKDTELEQVLVNARKLQSLRDSLLAKRKQLSSRDIRRLEKLIPESADNVKLIIEFENIAAKYNLDIKTASAQKDDKQKKSKQQSSQNFDIESRDYGIISLDFSIVGGYSEFIAFLTDVEDNIRISDVRNLSISATDNNKFEFSIAVETYWLKDNI